ncbi:hypothetical protein TYRP_016961 [Tyrophagus putrescentiae]|nr:hypothetical protein TYRP_016961 [Tyrophagus putrescentiae]
MCKFGNIFNQSKEYSPSNRKRGRLFVIESENGKLLAGVFGGALDHSQRVAFAVLAAQAHQALFGLIVEEVTRLGLIGPRAGEPGRSAVLKQAGRLLAAPVGRAQPDNVGADVPANTLRRGHGGESAGYDAAVSRLQRIHLSCAVFWRL